MYSQVDDRHRAVEDPTFTVVLQFHSEEDEPFQGSPQLPEIFLFVARSGLPFEQFPECTALHCPPIAACRTGRLGGFNACLPSEIP
jgi:hypothetical protein